MQCDFCTSNNGEYLDKEESYKGSAKEICCEFKYSLQHNQENTGQRESYVQTSQIIMQIFVIQRFQISSALLQISLSTYLPKMITS